MGLPAVARYPEATVRRGEERVEVLFGGPNGEQRLNVPLEYVGGDPEEAELRLLAQLQAMGYDARRAT